LKNLKIKLNKKNLLLLNKINFLKLSHRKKKIKLGILPLKRTENHLKIDFEKSN
jgi:hypothetical protein